MSAKAFDLAIKKLAKRAHSREELRTALEKAGFDEQETGDVLAKLQAEGYINDLLLAGELFAYHTTRKPCGPLLFAEILKKKGIPAEITASLLAEYSTELEIKLAGMLAQKYLAAKKTPAQRYAACRTLASYLERRGFSPDTVEQVVTVSCLDI